MAYVKFVTLDVFTSQPYLGNPLAVVFLPTKKDATTPVLTQHQKQTIAREFNLSETIFVHPGTGETRTIDIFTTDAELPFAGHPTIGASSWFLCHSTAKGDKGIVNQLLTKSGPIPIALQQPPKETAVVAKIAHNVHLHTTRFPLRELLRLHPSLAPYFPQNEAAEAVSFPVFSIVKGMNQVHIDLPSFEALAAVTTATGGEIVDSKSEFLDHGWNNGLCMTYFHVRDVESSNSETCVIRTRGILGNLEDPATGSAASGLAAYLSLKGGQSGYHQYEIMQGVEMGRRSIIGVGVYMKDHGQIDSVELKGSAVQVSEGSVLIPEE